MGKINMLCVQINHGIIIFAIIQFYLYRFPFIFIFKLSIGLLNGISTLKYLTFLYFKAPKPDYWSFGQCFRELSLEEMR